MLLTAFGLSKLLGSPSLCSPAPAAGLVGPLSGAAWKLCDQNISVVLSFPSRVFQLPGLQESFYRDHEQIPAVFLAQLGCLH